jgi:hypothetical protein
MLDNSYFFECACGSDEHTLRFTLDKEDNLIYTSIFLNYPSSFLGRIWLALKYIFGYKCKCGHWDCWILRKEDAQRLKNMLNELE